MLKKIICILILFPSILFADTENKTSAWFMSLTRVKFTEEIRGFLDLQPRLAIDDTKDGQDGDLDTVLFRGALGYQITPNIGIYQGYAAIPTYDPTRVEHRSFQEVLINHPLESSFTLAHRFRFEQRILQSKDDVALRLRYFTRATHPIASIDPNLSLAINEEVFVNVSDVDGGPQTGFNQNRLFLGVNYKFTKNVSLDFGYQNQYVEGRSGSADTINHIAFLGLITKVSFID